MANHTLEKNQWLVATSLTFGNSIKIDPILSHTLKVPFTLIFYSTWALKPARLGCVWASPR